MRNLCHVFVLGISLWSLHGCRVKQHTTPPIISPFQIASKKLGYELDSFPNSSGKLILFIQIADPKYPTRVIKAIVLELSSNNILMEESFVPGFIKWEGEYSLELLSLPGTIKSVEDISTYIRTIKLSLPNH